MASTHQDDDAEEEAQAPSGVIDGIRDVAEGRTADMEDFEEALDS